MTVRSVAAYTQIRTCVHIRNPKQVWVQNEESTIFLKIVLVFVIHIKLIRKKILQMDIRISVKYMPSSVNYDPYRFSNLILHGVQRHPVQLGGKYQVLCTETKTLLTGFWSVEVLKRPRRSYHSHKYKSQNLNQSRIMQKKTYVKLELELELDQLIQTLPVLKPSPLLMTVLNRVFQKALGIMSINLHSHTGTCSSINIFATSTLHGYQNRGRGSSLSFGIHLCQLQRTRRSK